MKLPVISTFTGALKEHLALGRGKLVTPEYTFIDTWGNSRRDMIGRVECAATLIDVEQGRLPKVDKARDYVVNRNWDKTVDQLLKGIIDVSNSYTKTTPEQ
jgi:hypothetical protein